MPKKKIKTWQPKPVLWHFQYNTKMCVWRGMWCVVCGRVGGGGGGGAGSFCLFLTLTSLINVNDVDWHKKATFGNYN